MSFWGRVRSVFARGDARADDPNRDYWRYPLPVFAAGIPLTSDGAQQLSAAWACMTAITTALSSAQWMVLGVQGQRRERLYNDNLEWLLNTRPNPEMTAMAFKEALLYGALSGTDGFAEIVFDGAKRVTELWPLDPRRMIVARNPDTYALEYRWTQQFGGEVVIPSERIYHLRGPSLTGLMGDNIIARAARSLAVAVAQETFTASYFANGTIVGGVLKFPGNLPKDAPERISAQFKERRRGPAKAHELLVLDGGSEFQEVGSDPAKAQLLEARRYSVEEICRWFGVPPSRIGHYSASSGTYNNIEAEGINWVLHGLTPWARRLEQEADSKLVPKPAPRITRLDLDYLARGSAKERAEADMIRLQSGVLSVNEIREELGKNSIGAEGDLRFVTTQLQPLTDTLLDIQELAAKEPEPPPAAQPTLAPDTGTEPAEADDAEDSPPMNGMLRQALLAMVTREFERQEKTFEKRAAYMARDGAKPEDVAAKLKEWRTEYRETLVEECAPAIGLIRQAAASQGRHINGEADLALIIAADGLSKHHDPKVAAENLLRVLLPETTA